VFFKDKFYPFFNAEALRRSDAKIFLIEAAQGIFAAQN